MQIEIMRMKAGGTARYRNVFHAGQVIFREFGIRGLFQGVQATCLRNTPACSIYFGMSGLFNSLVCILKFKAAPYTGLAFYSRQKPYLYLVKEYTVQLVD